MYFSFCMHASFKYVVQKAYCPENQQKWSRVYFFSAILNMWLWLSETQFHHAHPSPFPSFLKLFLSARADSLHVEQLCNLASSFTLRLHISLTLHEELLQYIQDPTRDLFYNHMPFSRHCYNLFACFLRIKLTPVSFLTCMNFTLEKCSTMLLPLAKIVAGNKILLYSFIP